MLLIPLMYFKIFNRPFEYGCKREANYTKGHLNSLVENEKKTAWLKKKKKQ